MPVLKPSHIHTLWSKAATFVVLLALTFIPVALTLPDYGVTFDEPIYMEAAWNVQKWLSIEPSILFDREGIDCYWKTDPLRNVHPSGLKWLYLCAQKSIFWEKNPYIQNRVLNVFILAVSLLVFFYSGGVRARFGEAHYSFSCFLLSHGSLPIPILPPLISP